MIRRWRVEIEFYAETPGDDIEADDMADNLSDIFKRVTNELSMVVADSAQIVDVNTIDNPER